MDIFKRVIRIISYVIVTCCVVGLIFCGLSSDRLDIVNYEIKTDKNIESFSCLVISDYHHRSLNFSNGNMIDILKKQKADYVFFTGDLIDSHTKSLEDVTKIFDASKGITNNCYFVTGNHEEYAPHWSELQKLMEQKKIKYLNDLDEDNENIHLFGLQDARFKIGGGASFKKREEAIKQTIDEKFKSKINNDDFNVLLVHRPENIKMIANNYNFDLVISGHTHGGQIKLGNWIPSTIALEEGQYIAGKYHVKNTDLVVSRGLGYSAMLPLRINCNPEIVKITVSK